MAEDPKPAEATRQSQGARLLDVLEREARGDGAKLIWLTILAGLANTLVLAVAVEATREPGLAARQLYVYLIAVGTYYACARWTYRRSAELVEFALHRIKGQLIDKIVGAELPALEQIGIAELHDRISETAATISSFTGPVTNLLMSSGLLLGASIYVLWLSPTAFALLALLLSVSIALFWRRYDRVRELLEAEAAARVEYFGATADLLYGAKEIKFSRARAGDLTNELAARSRVLRTVSVAAKTMFAHNHVFSAMAMFAALFMVAFVIPSFADVPATAITALATAVVFIWGPLAGLASGVPAFFRLQVAFGLLHRLEARLEGALKQAQKVAQRDPWGPEPGPIELRAVEYDYGDETGEFSLGPIDLRIEPGELVFLVGGNGSGKSTLCKVLTGLYPPTRGELRFNGVCVTNTTLAAYRQRYAAIFTDFHLFTKLYGQLDASPEAVESLLELLGLRSVTSFADGAFSRLELSTGQRKRLAMLVALLEDRPIYAFDEWAAEQESGFRREFYQELLPELTARGKTVIVVTHDDRYFACADTLVVMEEGRVRSIERREG